MINDSDQKSNERNSFLTKLIGGKFGLVDSHRMLLNHLSKSTV